MKDSSLVLSSSCNLLLPQQPPIITFKKFRGHKTLSNTCLVQSNTFFLVVKGQPITSLKVPHRAHNGDTQVLSFCFMSANFPQFPHLSPHSLALPLMMFKYQESPSSKPSRTWSTPGKWTGWSHSGIFCERAGVEDADAACSRYQISKRRGPTRWPSWCNRRSQKVRFVH